MIAESELPFVDEKSGVEGAALILTGDDSIDDFIERHDHIGKSSARTKPQREKRGG